MHTAMDLPADYDVTDIPSIVRGAVKLGLIEAVTVLVFSLASRFLPAGPIETVVQAVILLAGLYAVTQLPGLWTHARTIEGIAGAAGIGLGACLVFLLLDVSLLQNIGTYSNRWAEIGGGATWWYHPVWWMVGSFLPWMGAWILANQTVRRGQPSAATGFLIALGGAAVIGIGAILLGILGARWSLGTFAVAFLPGLVLATIISAVGERRS